MKSGSPYKTVKVEQSPSNIPCNSLILPGRSLHLWSEND